MVATQNIDTLGPIWTFSLRGVLTFVASGLDINGCVCWVILRGQQIYTVIQAVHSLLYIVANCHFFSVVTWKDIIKYLQNVRGVLTSVWYCIYLCSKHCYFCIKHLYKRFWNDLSQGLSVCLTTFKMAENLVGRKWKPLDFNSTELGIIQPIANYCKSMIWIITSQTQPLWYMLRYRFWTEETLSQRSTRLIN